MFELILYQRYKHLYVLYLQWPLAVIDAHKAKVLLFLTLLYFLECFELSSLNILYNVSYTIGIMRGLVEK